jgi:hypothetical protein
VAFQTTHRDVQFLVHRAEWGRRAGLRRVALSRLSTEAISSAALQVIRAAGQDSSPADRFKA